MTLGVTVASLVLALAGVRWLAPELLGRPADMRVVQASDKVPPFFANVFARQDKTVSANDGFLLNDPATLVRARPLYPEFHPFPLTDLLGFPNRAIPNVADVVAIGDSQTVGNNAIIEESWPGVLRGALGGARVVYTMATGGWAAPQYLAMAHYARAFQPYAAVIAFYTGNDALESFRTAYQIDGWSSLRLDKNLKASDEPAIPFPPPQDEQWPITFPDGLKMVFAPKLRFIANDRAVPAVRTGYRIMAEVARQAAAALREAGVRAVFTVIPTKELAYRQRLTRDGIAPSPAYTTLMDAEQGNIDELVTALRGIQGAHYVDVIAPLQQAALGKEPLYPVGNANGHPIAAGYRVIGEALAATVGSLLPSPLPLGVYFARVDGKDGKEMIAALVTKEGVWLATEERQLERNGWPEGQYPEVPIRALATLPHLGFLREVAPQRFGPAALGVKTLPPPEG